MAHVRMDGAWLCSVDFPSRSAGLAGIDITTKDWHNIRNLTEILRHTTRRTAEGDDLCRGIPLKKGGNVVGAIGASGGSAIRTRVAEAGAAEFRL